ncbi:MAG: ATP phosphoribosyltransferase regulatory subunit [Dehalococcoidia bacterium]
MSTVESLEETPAPSGASGDNMDHVWRSRGMRDFGPDEMRRFRRAERAFLDVTSSRGYVEIRTPAIEPLHLFTATGSLSPQLLDRVYSFLDWDGWSGERVVLRPDNTVPAARWYEAHWHGASPARLSYVQPVYRFEPGDEEREQWQCGVELFDLGALEADRELLVLGADVLAALGLSDLTFELAHAGLVRAILDAAGLDPVAQLATYDRLLQGDPTVVTELIALHPDRGAALRLLFDVDGTGGGYIANLRSSLGAAVPGAEGPLLELEAAAAALDDAGYSYRLVPATARNFEYYTGLTFRLSAGSAECVRGGRYDGLGGALGDRSAPASGFAADLVALATLLEAYEE